MAQRMTSVNVPIKRWSLDGNISEVISYLQNLRTSVPQEYRDSLQIEIYADNEHGDPSVNITAWYERPTTQEELDVENQAEFEQLQRRKKYFEDQLAALNKKVS